MMNKYTIGTIVGTALLGLAKKRLGSNVKIRIGHERHYEGFIIYSIREDEYLRLNNKPEVLKKISDGIQNYINKMNGTFKYEVKLVLDIDLDDNEFYGLAIWLYANSYHKKPREEDEYNLARYSRRMHSEIDYVWDGIIDYLTSSHGWDETPEILLVDFDELVSSDFTLFTIENIPMTLNKEGDWVPYKKPESKSNLRLR